MKPSGKQEQGKSIISSFNSSFLLLHTNSHQLRNGFIHLYDKKNPTLLCKGPEVPLLNGFPSPGAVLAPKKNNSGAKVMLREVSAGGFMLAGAKESKQWCLVQFNITIPSSCTHCVGHHQQAVGVNMFAWLQPGQASAAEHEDDLCPPQQVELHHRVLSARSCGLLGHQPALPTLGLALANNRVRRLVHSTWVIQPISSYFPLKNFQGESQVFAPVFSHIKK